jgi:uncharacterized glyoxalase superfamily protein PhnB
MQSITPNLAVKNIKESIKFYKKLGFELIMAVPEDKSSFGTELDDNKIYVWAMMKNGNIELMLQKAENLKEDIGEFFDKIGASLTIYVRLDDVDAFYKKLPSDIKIVKDIDTTWYGMREFYIQDCDGYILGFATQRTS